MFGIVAVSAAAPTAVGLDVAVGNDFCDGGFCVPTSACVDGIYCQATPCDPANDCRARAAYAERCEQNVTIGGETCAARLTLGAAAGGRNVATPGTTVVPGAPVPGSSVDVPVNSVEAEVDLTRGFVHDEHLPNEWLSHAAFVRATVLGVDTGATWIRVYQSHIDAPGGDDEDHAFTHGSTSIEHEGAAARGGAAAGATLLDGWIEDCDVAAGSRDATLLTCENLLG